MRWPNVAAALAAVLLAGCATVPTSGPVRSHEAGQQQVESGVRVAPVPPVPDAPAMLIVEGFLHAMGTDQVGFPIARQYLTEEANRTWHPESGTQIYADGYQPRETDTSTENQPVITLEAALRGTLDADGVYTEVSGGHRQDFGLVREDGQWRISHPPDGLLISRYHFENNYTTLDLHFLDPSGTVLVPDPRHIARNALTPLALAELQVAGPGAWLAPAVRQGWWPSSLIDQVELLPQGVANLHLSQAAVGFSDAQRHTLMAELTTTLTVLPQVTAVQFSVGDTLLPLPETNSTTLTASDFVDLSPVSKQRGGQLLAVRENTIRTVSRTEPWSEGNPVGSGLAAPGTIAARSDLAEIAAVNPERTELSVAAPDSDTAQLLLTDEQLLRPDYSRQNELWAIGHDADAAGFVVFSADEHVQLPVVAEGIPAEAVRAFRISPDGTRIALVLDGSTAGGQVEQLGMARIVRSADGIALQEFRPVTVSPPAEAARQILDVGWSTATELMVLVKHQVTSSVIRVDQDSAFADDFGPADVVGLRELAVVPNGQAVVRGGSALYRFEGPFNWEATGLVADAVCYS